METLGKADGRHRLNSSRADSTSETTGGRAAPAPVYIPPHKMATAPPGNESSDWLAPPRPATSLPHAPPLSEAPAQSLAGGSKSAESLLQGGGAGGAGSWKARETLLPAARSSVTGGRGGAPQLGSAFFSCQCPGSTQPFCSDLSSTSVREGTPSPICPSMFLASSDRASWSPDPLLQFPIRSLGSAL